jgi:hypothetical protein
MPLLPPSHVGVILPTPCHIVKGKGGRLRRVQKGPQGRFGARPRNSHVTLTVRSPNESFELESLS